MVEDGQPAAQIVLLGPLSIDRYVGEGAPAVAVPGGGVMNMAVHWANDGIASTVLSRVGADASALVAMLRHHAITSSSALVCPGSSSSVEVSIGADRQPSMNRFQEGVWHELRLTTEEDAIVAAAKHLHVVLVTGGVDELARLSAAGTLRSVTVSGDFLSFRRYTIERFASTMAHLGIAFVGWPGPPDDPVVDALAGVVFELGKLAVVTMGASRVVVFDGRHGATDKHVFPVEAQRVTGTTAGCGDAFIARFLSTWWATGDIGRSVTAGMRHGALATSWRWALPDSAYPS